MRELLQVNVWIIRLAVLIGFALMILIGYFSSMGKRKTTRVIQNALAGWAVANILFIVFLWFNHCTFPFTLNVMEDTILQHFQRAAVGQSVYPQPSPSYTALVYNPLFYFLAIPFSWVLGVNLMTLRIVAIIGTIGIGAVLFAVTKLSTNSLWWGLIAAGVFAAAYRVMDAYLDTAHSDSWMVCLALAGSLVLDRSRSRQGKLFGVFLLMCSFWMKQHGAFFALGGMLYLTLKDGPLRSIPYWLAAIFLGPVLYIFLGPALFGTHFHYFTYTIPSQWTEVTGRMFPRYVGFFLVFYSTLVWFALWHIVREWKMNQKIFDVWRIQLVAAMLTAVLGCLDPGSSDNIFIPMGVFLILEGIRGIHAASGYLGTSRYLRVEVIALSLVFTQLAYDPRTVVASSEAPEALADLKSTLKVLPGSVYAPWVGQFQDGLTLYPAVHWVALLDIIRGPIRNPRNDSIAASLLAPSLQPNGPMHVLTNLPLRDSPTPLNRLAKRYVLVADFGDRFKALRVLPGRIDCLWPRYLYYFDPGKSIR
jgi:hypothetical protein